MPNYEYIAIEASGKKTKGSITAESPYAARKQLRMRGIHASQITEVTAAAEKSKTSMRSLFRRSNKSHLVDFTKQMSTLLNSGIKLTEALSVMTLQTTDPRFRSVLVEIRDRVITGESFAEALRDHSDYFDVIYVSMIKVGEVTGSMGGSLATIAGFMEKRQKVESKVLTAMIYPIVLIIFCLVSVLVLTAAVIPRIGEQIKKTGQELPWITDQLMNVGYVLTSPWVLLVLAILALVGWILRRFFATDRGAMIKDRALLSLPMFGPLLRQRVVARFASTLSTLLGSGLAMAESLKVVSEVTGNAVMKKAVQGARERILSGADISTPLKDSGVISPAIAHMVAVGERSGELEHMLEIISEDLEAQTDMVIERLSAAVEPMILVVMAVIIGVIAYATILPILQISEF